MLIPGTKVSVISGGQMGDGEIISRHDGNYSVCTYEVTAMPKTYKRSELTVHDEILQAWKILIATKNKTFIWNESEFNF